MDGDPPRDLEALLPAPRHHGARHLSLDQVHPRGSFRTAARQALRRRARRHRRHRVDGARRLLDGKLCDVHAPPRRNPRGLDAQEVRRGPRGRDVAQRRPRLAQDGRDGNARSHRRYSGGRLRRCPHRQPHPARRQGRLRRGDGQSGVHDRRVHARPQARGQLCLRRHRRRRGRVCRSRGKGARRRPL